MRYGWAGRRRHVGRPRDIVTDIDSGIHNLKSDDKVVVADDGDPEEHGENAAEIPAFDKEKVGEINE